MSVDPTEKFSDSQDDKLNRILAMVQSTNADVQDVKARLTRLEQTIAERLYDTRPLWEGVQAQISEMREEMEKSFRRFGHKVDRLNNEVAEPYADHRDIEERVDNLEKKVS